MRRPLTPGTGPRGPEQWGERAQLREVQLLDKDGQQVTVRLPVTREGEHREAQWAAAGILVDALQDAIPSVSIAVGAEAANVIQVTVQFLDAAGNNLAERMAALMWLADAANGAVTGDVPSGGWAAGVGTLLHTLTADALALFTSDANGVVRVDITEAAVDTWYLHVLVGGRVYVSGAVTFA